MVYVHRQYWSHTSIRRDAIILPDLPRLFTETEHGELQRHRDVIHKALEMETIQPGLEPRIRGTPAQQLVAHLREQERRAKYRTWCSLGATITSLTVMAGATLACYRHRLTDICGCKASDPASRTSGDNRPEDEAGNGQRQSASYNPGGGAGDALPQSPENHPVEQKFQVAGYLTSDE
jgi:hypothetical protein